MNDPDLSNKISPQNLESIQFDNNFLGLPADFYVLQRPGPIQQPYLIDANKNLMLDCNINPSLAENPDFCQIFSGNRIAEGSTPLASVYSGHQFGVWAGQLGDGRAILLGDIASKTSRLEVQLKGSGITPYSRGGDGRAVLRSSIREYLCSEAMHHLGIPSSRALCIIGSDQYVMREQPETLAVVTRLAPSFIRFGSFEHWYYTRQHDHLRSLADFVIQHYYPELQATDQPYLALLRKVCQQTAHLIAKWQSVGFMHGVMNTDNMSILGLTLDYGPFSFMEAFDPNTICNHSDTHGRYSYQMQPSIGLWNCHALAQALLPLIGSVDAAQDALAEYQSDFTKQLNQIHQEKFGFAQKFDEDQGLIDAFYTLLQDNQADFTLAFRQLGKISCLNSQQDFALTDLFIDRNAVTLWLEHYRSRLCKEKSEDQLRQECMNKVNPKYILRNYLAQIAIEKAQNKDFSEVRQLLSVLEHPYDEQPEFDHYAQLPPSWAQNLSLSCSS